MPEVTKQMQPDSESKLANIPLQMRSDAFTALAIALMQGWLISSDTKYFVFKSLLRNLEKMGYTEEEMNPFKEALAEAITKFQTKNDFMG